VSAIFADRYEIVSVLGQGGMAIVYRARDRKTRGQVALKVLGAKHATADNKQRFGREARAIARLDHPGCVKILDHGTVPRRFIAMELLEGPTLLAVLRKGALPAARSLAIARELLTALAHAHAKGVLHRDVKPENVMLPPDRAVLIDFGLASLHDEPATTGVGMCIGSPSYLAPERLLGHAYDARADLYAVGVLLYEMLAGVRPFRGDSPEEIMRSALHRPAPPLRAIARDVAPPIAAIVARALAKDPAKRFNDAVEMLGALA
jgi:serine/threonine-protein kinase